MIMTNIETKLEDLKRKPQMHMSIIKAIDRLDGELPLWKITMFFFSTKRRCPLSLNLKKTRVFDFCLTFLYNFLTRCEGL